MMTIKKSYLILVFAVAVFISCNEQTLEKDVVFNEALGENYTGVLHELRKDFEFKLKDDYPELSIVEAYQQLLVDFADNPKKDESNMLTYKSKKTDLLFAESGFKNDLYYKEKSQDRINNLGLYMKALYKIGAEDTLIRAYHEFKQNAGIRTAHFFSKGFLTYNPNFNKEVHRIIVVMEFTY